MGEEHTEQVQEALGALRQRLVELEKVESERHGEQRRRLAVEHVHRVILEMEKVEDFDRVAQVIAEELKLLGTEFEAIGLNIIDEDQGTLTVFGVDADHLSVQSVNSLEYPSNRELVKYWRQRKVWEREPDQAFLDVSKGYGRKKGEEYGYAPKVVIDAPFEQGTLAVGLDAQIGESEALIQLLEEFCSLASLGYRRSRDLAARHQAEQDLRRANDRLEDRVRERTNALARVNESLQKEVSERQRIEDQLKSSLGEKEVLLKEIHHRVKNNLQIVSSLLDLQARYIEDPPLLAMLQDSHNRVHSMALIHERLYQSTDLAHIDLDEYLRSLTGGLFHSYGMDPSAVKLDIRIEQGGLGIDEAVPCGLIVSELVSNAFKYAFPAGRQGTVWIGLDSSVEGMLVLSVRDDGVGFPQGLDFERTESLGLRLVVSLARQLHGEIELDRAEGTTFSITFPIRQGTHSLGRARD